MRKAAAVVADRIATASSAQLVDLRRLVSRRFEQRQLSRHEAIALLAAIRARRAGARSADGGTRSGDALAPMTPSAAMPSSEANKATSSRVENAVRPEAAATANLRGNFTAGQRAALEIVAAEVASMSSSLMSLDGRKEGICKLTIGEIGRRAGVSPTVVKEALRRAESEWLIARQARAFPEDPNTVRILRPDRLEQVLSHAASRRVPPFTSSQSLVMKVVADEIAGQGVCAMSFAEIGFRAGVSKGCVKVAIAKARRCGYIAYRERSNFRSPNLIVALRSDWIEALSRRKPPRPAAAFATLQRDVLQAIEDATIGGICYLPVGEIMERTGASRKTVEGAIRKARSCGLIEVVRAGPHWNVGVPALRDIHLKWVLRPSISP